MALAPTTARRLMGTVSDADREADTSGRLSQLTDRERTVFDHVARGDSNATIASNLQVAEVTVKAHVSHIFAKLELTDRASLIAWAHQHRLVGRSGSRGDR
jgi:DNA-binding NarL/FixJ family response regulator